MFRKGLDSRSTSGLITATLAAGLLAACSGPTTPAGDPLQLTCPNAITSETPSGNPQAITYSSPTATGGNAPITTTCTPASGTVFAKGTTAVNCSGHDSRSQTASCSFNVTVAKTPQLSATQFLSFGDSITEGKQSMCSATLISEFAAIKLDMQRARADFEAGPSAYPRVLEGMLRARYALQTVNVVNEGCGGEQLNPDILSPAACGDGNAYQRLRDRLRDHPQTKVLLLQEGTNDVANHFPPANIAGVLRDMVRDAKSRGIQPLVGALIPRVPGSCRAGPTEDIPIANEQIRAMANAEGVVYVDLYGGFGANYTQYIGVDGLHPNDAGYQKIAELFMASIKANFEIP